MKKSGNTCDYTAAKNAELVKIFNAKIREAKLIDLDRIFLEVSQSEASRFFISEDRAYELILAYRKAGRWLLGNSLRREMMEEIRSRTEAYMREDSALSLKDAVYMAVNSRAPKFYLTPRTCRTLIYATTRASYMAAKKYKKL